MNQNGQVEQMDNVEIIPDYENEITEVQEEAPPKKKGCGCNKNKKEATQNDVNKKTNWLQIALIVGGIIAAIIIFKKMSKGKIEIPKVEVPEV